MRRASVVLAFVATLGVLATPAVAVPRHEHHLETPGTTTTIAGGVSHNAPCIAFVTFHESVHLAVLAAEGFPLTVTVTFIDGEC
jgi:hypothetical protein